MQGFPFRIKSLDVLIDFGTNGVAVRAPDVSTAAFSGKTWGCDLTLVFVISSPSPGIR